MLTWKWSTAIYTTNRIVSIDDVDFVTADFIVRASERAARIFHNKFDPMNFNFAAYMREHLFLVCYNGTKPVGGLLARLQLSLWDHDIRILYQDLLYVEPGNPRAAHQLMQRFIEFGRANADHIFTMKTKNTNIKEQSLEKLGFEPLEILYRMEV